MDARTFVKKAVNRSKRLYREDAPRSMRQAYERFLDWRQGVETAGITQLETLSIDSPSKSHGKAYEPTPMLLFNLAMKRLNIRHEDYVFVDLGSGKGRTLLGASHYPFRELIGVDFSSELNEIARTNLQNYRNRRRKSLRWRVEYGDAAEFRFPDENVVLFLFNPFDATILRGVLENIVAYIRGCRKSIYIVYCNPMNATVFDSCQQLVLQEEIPVPKLLGLRSWLVSSIRIYKGGTLAGAP